MFLVAWEWSDVNIEKVSKNQINLTNKIQRTLANFIEKDVFTWWS